MAAASGLTSALNDRLVLDDKRIEAMAKGVEDVAALDDPVGRELARWTRPNGLDIARVATPIGVIGIIYESRPNVTADAAALCLKSGNACILRGGSESVHSSRAIHAAMVEGLRAANLPEAAIQLVPTTDRAAVGMMLKGLNGAIDLIIPRGGKSLVGRVQEEARVPVLAHLEGICHVYIHAKADLGEGARDRAERQDAAHRHLRRGGNAADRPRDAAIAWRSDPAAISQKAGCEIRGDEAVREIFPDCESRDRRRLAHRISRRDHRGEGRSTASKTRSVTSKPTARTTPNRIVTEDAAAAEHFLAALDSAIVMWNASTQFADGGEFGMGAEIGIGTGKLHARGPGRRRAAHHLQICRARQAGRSVTETAPARPRANWVARPADRAGCASGCSAARSIRRMRAIFMSANVALKRLGLDYVWWLVTPQNPLKPDRRHGAAAASGCLRARRIRAPSAHHRGRCRDTHFHTHYSIDTLKRAAEALSAA